MRDYTEEMRERMLVYVTEVVQAVAYPGYRFDVSEMTRSPQHMISIRVVYEEPDVYSQSVETQYGRHWVIPAESTPGQIVQTCFKAILTSLEHRAREHFTYKGLMPHMDIEELVHLSQRHAELHK